ncbi:antitoxin [Helicobacter canis]|uniref:Putative virulence-associated protein n=1 Tax=Helicobacter canis TaxID=29419 RepID=A0A377J1P2_9HELI|nr:hypothetical protein [Helicobacter canis]STO96204.1 putative virulence-associated protein [Helicobacter canis]STO96269.1 putative virulence-associated protein [Helicobacter canis]
MTAKVFQSGNSLAIRLPKSLNLSKDCAFEIAKINESIVLTPSDKKWENLFSAVESFQGKLERTQESAQEREWQK